MSGLMMKCGSIFVALAAAFVCLAPAPRGLLAQGKADDSKIVLDEFSKETTPWNYVDGREFPGAKGSFALDKAVTHSGKGSYKLQADFTGGGAYVGTYRFLGDLKDEDVKAIHVWIKSDNVTSIGVRLIDSSDQCHQAGVKLAVSADWQEVILKIADLAGGEHWGGANDGKWHGPIKGVGINVGKLSFTEGSAAKGAINIDDVVLDKGHVLDGHPTVLGARLAPASCRPGFEVRVTYRWDAEPMGRDMKVFVHGVAGDGKMALQGDFAPSTATSIWSGKVEETQRMYVPIDTPEGEYKIIVGLYDSKGRAELKTGQGAAPATGPDGERGYLVGTIKVDANAPLPVLPKPTLNLDGYKMTFDDEFQEMSISAAGPDTRWFTATKENFGDARFMEQKDGFPFSVQDGIIPNKKVLRIEAAKKDGVWCAGIIASADPKGVGFSQKFGYFEMRAKFPKSRGMWPAFWLLGQPALATRKGPNPEIDVIEAYGVLPHLVISTVHVWNREPSGEHWAQGDHMVSPADLSDDFHRYGVMIDDANITFYFDGVEFEKQKTPAEAKVPLYMLVNLAMGSGWPIDKAVSPSYMYVDYVRAYAKKP